MRKSHQSKIALLCVFLISKTLFASEVPRINGDRTGITPKPSGIPSFGGGSSGITPKPGVLPSFGGGSGGITPKPGVLPSFGGGSGGNPRPTLPDFGLGPKKISGAFGTPEAELLKGNFANAAASCIQEAIQGGDKIPNFNSSSVWEFASGGSSRTRPLPKLSPAMSALRSKLSSTAQTPAALANKPCQNDLKHSACVGLLSKATTEVTQAYYNSALNKDRGVWDEVLTFLGLMPMYDENNESLDIVEALKKAQDKQNKERGEKKSIDLSPVANQDPLLVATQLIIQRIDESLARGDKDGADKGKALLKRINPSAEHAVTCVLGNAKFGGLNQDLDPSGHPYGSYFGPLSGIDYGKQDELKTHEPMTLIVITAVGVAIAAATLVTMWVNAASDAEAQKKTEEFQNKTTSETSLRDYLNCTGVGCDTLYPEAAARVKEAKEKETKAPVPGTAGPGKPVEKTEDDMWAPSVKQDPLPPGSGGGKGELVPWEDQLIKEDNSKKLAAQKEWQKHQDPQASARFCETTVKDYKDFSLKKITSSGRSFDVPTKALDPLPTEAFGVVQFEKWDNAYWAQQKKNKEFDPEYQAKQNNCRVMNEVQGL